MTGYTFEGSWGYVEHEWTATAGTFIFEPAGETHTLVVRPEAVDVGPAWQGAHAAGALDSDLIGLPSSRPTVLVLRLFQPHTTIYEYEYMALSPEQIAQFHRDGHLVVSQLLDADAVNALRKRTEDIAAGRTAFPSASIEFEPDARNQAPHINNLRKLNECARHDEVFLRHAKHPAILGVVADLLGEDIKLFGDQLFLKPPGGIEKTYHQDSPYFPIEPMSLVSSWVALDDATIDNGCLWVVPGSHQAGALAHSEVWMVGDRQDMCVPDSAFDRSAERPVLMKAGDVSFHHSLLLHRSGPNLTQQRRRGMATHYMSARSRWTDPHKPQPDYLLLQGREYPGCV
ncbi:MAG: phytanoyl-CoA dioxygenase family protein [Gammaproteobacteria bacterium]|nr:phytanoyl-CoA dioxygenase family protein [Gammaproteobacteria bacterium]